MMLVEITYPKPKEHRKVKIKVINRDLWSADATMALVILAVLKKFRKTYDKPNNSKGYPSIFSAHHTAMTTAETDEEYNKRYEEFEKMTEEQHKAREKAEEKLWTDCLDKMIYSFDHIAYDRDFPWEIQMHKEATEAVKAAGLKHIGIDEWFSQEAQEVRHPIYEKYRQHTIDSEKQIQEGLDLFAKHFRNIWD